MPRIPRYGAALLAFALLTTAQIEAQVVRQRGFVEARGVAFPQGAADDVTQTIGDLLAREELFLTLTPWLQFAGGAELRANSHDQVEEDWRVDFTDRGLRRPRLTVRRATATLTRRGVTIDIGKQFIRWGKTDVINPTDRFAPRDSLNVVDGEFLAVTGVRAAVRLGDRDTLEVVWVPRLTPSRVPLLDQRWTVIPAEASQVQIVDGGSVLPTGAQTGLRWSRVGRLLEYSVSFFDGYNHFPTIDARIRQVSNAVGRVPAALVPEIEVVRVYPALRSYGVDAALPTRWFTVKGEAAYFASTSVLADEYLLFVIQLERQKGEWVFVGGYAGESVTDRRVTLVFAPDRGLTRSVVGHVSYTIDANRSLAFETAVHENLAGAYVKAEYAQSRGQHWRATISGAVIRGAADDFLGQYRRNSYVSLVVRYSF